MLKCTIFLLFAFLLVSADPRVPNTYTLLNNYTIIIHGTSNLRDWQDTVEKVTGEMVAKLNEDGSVDLNIIHIKMEVGSIKSDMGAVMDSKTFEALRGKTHPDIIFVLDAPKKLTQVSPGENGLSVDGNLTLAGITRPVIMQVRSFTLGEGKLEFEGLQQIKMTDYGVKPPTALFGILKANPAITITFKTSFSNK
jgi:polyisoprenoid-binding protein YceI